MNAAITSTFARKAILAVSGGILAVTLAGCSGGSQPDDKTIVVGASPTPHAEILKAAEGALADQGYTLEIKEFTDYVLPNTALEAGELDANYFQHTPYLENFNAENGTDIASAAAIHYEPIGIYAGKSSDLESIKDGAQIAVPSDATNEARALQLLAAQGIIGLKDGVGLEATVKDIVENPHNVQILEIEAANIANTLADVDFGVINGNYALDAGLSGRALAQEASDSEAAQTFANIVAVRSADVDSEKTEALVSALQSDEVKRFIEDNYQGAVVSVF